MTLNKAVNSYNEQLEVLINAKLPELGMIIDILIARDSVHNYLQKETYSLRIDKLIEIRSLDEKLKQQLLKQEQLISQNYLELEELKYLRSPISEAWWWDFKKPIHILDRFDWLFNLGTLFCLGFSFSITIELISRILEGEGDLVLSLVAACQASITLWIGKTFLTKNPGEIINKIITKILNLGKISKYLHAELSFIIAFVIAISTLLFRVSYIPYLSDQYIIEGNRSLHNNNISEAFRNFQKAVNLDPQNIEAKYKLGEIYDQTSLTKKAKTLYELGIVEGYAGAYNNLGRLLIKEGEYDQSKQLLLRGFSIVSAIEEKIKQSNINDISKNYLEDYLSTKYSLLKNLGWVNYKQGNNDEAKLYLEKAIKQEKELSEERGAAHCLLAEVLQYELSNKTKTNQYTDVNKTKEIIDKLNICRDKINQQIKIKQRKPTSEERDWGDQAAKKIRNLKSLKKQVK